MIKKVFIFLFFLALFTSPAYSYVTTDDTAVTTNYSLPYIIRGTFGWDDKTNDGMQSIDTILAVISEDISDIGATTLSDRINIISTDIFSIDASVSILSDDAVDWEYNRVSDDTILRGLQVDTYPILIKSTGTISVDTISVDSTLMIGGAYTFPETGPNDPGDIISWDGTKLLWGPAIGGVGVFASQELDDLGTVAINTSLLSDGNGVDDLGSSTKRWKETFTVSADVAGHIEQSVGWFTSSAQPAFLVALTAMTNISTDTYVTLSCDVAVFDQGSNFNSTAGYEQFTAPVTGRYQLNLNIILKDLDADATDYNLHIHTTNRDYSSTIYCANEVTVDGQAGRSITALADMTVGDVAFIRVYQNGGAAQTDISAGQFSGFLAY